MSSEYFATLPTDEIGNELKNRVDAYYRYIESSWRLYIWRSSYRQYYRGYFNRGNIGRDGDNGEILRMDVNHYHNILAHIKSLAVGQRPSWDCRSLNSDHKSISQTIIAQNLIDNRIKEYGDEKKIDAAARLALMFGEGWIYTYWDKNEGKPYAAVEGQIVNEGDMQTKSYGPIDIVRDINAVNLEECDWFIIRTMYNKFDLAKMYPNFADDIIAMGADTSIEMPYKKIRMDTHKTFMDSDLVTHYTFVHKKTPTLPNGRITEFVDADIILVDGEMPYEKFPLTCITAESQEVEPFGYSIAFDLMPVQRAYDGMNTAALTNILTFGINNIVVNNGSDVDSTMLSGGLRLLKGNFATNGKPEVLKLLSTAPEVYNYMQMTEKYMETLSGVNAALRGDPGANIKSGSYAALMVTMATQFSSNFQNAYARFLEDYANSVISIYKKFATTKRQLQIVGKNNKQYYKEFDNTDIEGVMRVFADVGNAVTRSASGRISLAENLLEKGIVKTADEYMQVITTGKSEPLTEAKTSQLMRIRAENEQLADGINPPVLATDCHTLDIQEHHTVLSSPDSRGNPVVVKATLDHINMHIDALMTTRPEILQIIGEPVLQPPMPSMPMQGAPGVPMPPAGNPAEQQVQKQLPNLPPEMQGNPAMQDQYNQVTGQ